MKYESAKLHKNQCSYELAKIVTSIPAEFLYLQLPFFLLTLVC